MFKESTQHWMKQRATGLAILLFSIVFAIIFYYQLSGISFFNDSNILLTFLAINLICIYHGALGMTVIIEDYIKNHNLKKGMIFLVNFLSIISFIVTIPSFFAPLSGMIFFGGINPFLYSLICFSIAFLLILPWFELKLRLLFIYLILSIVLFFAILFIGMPVGAFFACIVDCIVDIFFR